MDMIYFLGWGGLGMVGHTHILFFTHNILTNFLISNTDILVCMFFSGEDGVQTFP